MYEFIDTTESSEGVSLPSEALKINGEYIENQIEGYRTLTVEGREALSPEVTTFETGIRDGSTLKGKRYPARVIRITYQLIAASNEAFRAAYNKLAHILDVTDAELIFNDETDKYLIGTPAQIGEVEPGRNAVIGEFEIICLDPFKYSVTEYEASPIPGDSSILIDYNGTYKSYPTLQAEMFNENEASEDGETVTELTGSGDCGYVAFFTEDEKIIQIGDPEEVDGETAYEPSQTLVNQKFNTAASWGTAAQSLWAVNSGTTSSSAVEQAGTPSVKEATPEIHTVPPAKSATILTKTSYAEKPYVHYKILAKTDNRTETSVKVTITVQARLDNSDSYFGNGYALRGRVYIDGDWYNLDLKSTKDYWRGASAHSKSFTITVKNLAATDTYIAAIQFEAVRLDSTGGKTGILEATSCDWIPVSPYTAAVPATYYLTGAPYNYGTGENWHGPSVTRTIPADAKGDIGAANFTLSYSQYMCIGKVQKAGLPAPSEQLGAFQVLLVSGSGSSKKIVAGVNVYKGSSGKKAKLRFYLNNTVKETIDIDLSYNNQYFNSSKTSIIRKVGSNVFFNIGGFVRSYYDVGIAQTAVTEMTFTFSRFGSKEPLEFNGLYWVKFVKNNCDTWRDIPNKFSANDVVEADCKNGEIFLNGSSAPEYGALGNDWEGFVLTPGLNQIGFSYSDWVPTDYAPSFKVKYREVFL